MDIHNLNEKEKIKFREQYLQLDFPYSYGISLGEWICNRKCRMCPQYNLPPEETRMISDEVFYKACDIVGDREVSLEISAYGETFQHPNAVNYMFEARKRAPNATIVVATNGDLLNEDVCQKIIDSKIDHLSFSLDAGSQEGYKWLTGSSKYEKVTTNLKKLVQMRDEQEANHLKISCHIIGVKELEHEFDVFLNTWEPIVDHAYVRTYGNWAGMVDNNSVSPAEKQVIPQDRYPCAWLWYATKVEPNGDVSKCFIHITGDNDPLGNIMEEDFVDIWKGKKMAHLRKLHQKNDISSVEHCETCIVWSLFPNFWDNKGNIYE